MSIRSAIHTRRFSLIGAAVLLAVALAWGALTFAGAVYVPVVMMYHSVGAEGATLDGYGAKLNVTPEAFARQMQFLHEHGYTVLPLESFIERIKRKERIPHKTVAITFDDGLKNNFQNAYPVLKKYRFPATIFVATDFVGKKRFLTRDDIRIMRENGISIGSHTVSHVWLPSLTEEGIRSELVRSREILEKMTGERIAVLSYPLGAFDGRVRSIAEEVGYTGAVSTNPGPDYPDRDPYALKRIRISMTSDNLFVFWIETSGYYTFIKEMRDEE
jgi:peptidoglycan/xylan/chitin deacetylase (PgdA/CDA1 family)